MMWNNETSTEKRGANRTKKVKDCVLQIRLGQEFKVFR